MTIASSSYVPVSLSSFAPEARIWLFGFDRQLENDELVDLAAVLNEFIDSWHTHKVEVQGTFAVIEGRFLLVIARNDVSGCSKDSLMRALSQVEQTIGVRALDGLRIFYRSESGEIDCVDRASFSKLLRDGVLDKNTPVFNLGLTSFAELDGGLFEQPLEDSVFSRFINKIA